MAKKKGKFTNGIIYRKQKCLFVCHNCEYKGYYIDGADPLCPKCLCTLIQIGASDIY